MNNINGPSLGDFLDAAVRHGYVDRYEMERRHVRLIVKGEEHRLDHQRAWTYVSGLLYEWMQSHALENPS